MSPLLQKNKINPVIRLIFKPSWLFTMVAAAATFRSVFVSGCFSFPGTPLLQLGLTLSENGQEERQGEGGEGG